MITTRQLSIKGILKPIDVEIPSGVIVGLCGPNGSGKTSFLRALCGLSPPSTGEAIIQGKALQLLTDLDRAFLMSWVPAEQPTSFDYTVEDIVMWGRWPRHLGHPSLADRNACSQALDVMNISSFSSRPLPSLSLGEQKKVHLARAMASESPVMLLDEPLGPLDLESSLNFLNWARTWVKTGGTLVLSIHDLATALNHTDMILLLHEGAVAGFGPTESTATPEAIRQVFGVEVSLADSDRGLLSLFCLPSPKKN